MAPKALSTAEWEYTQIANLKAIPQLFSVVGIVAAHRPIQLSKGTDYSCSVTICDPTRSLLGSGLMCQMFRQDPQDLPNLQRDGDVIFLREIKIQLHNNDTQGITTWNTEWCIYFAEKNRQTSGFHLSKEEVSYAKELLNWWKNKGGTIAAKGIPAAEIAAKPKSKSFTLIKDIQPSRFYDILGEIVKIYPGTGNPYTVYITDYTSNPLLHNVEWGSQPKWQGPYGQYTLQLSIWDVHAKAAEKLLKEGGFCWVHNMRGKVNQDGHLEGALHGDRMFPDRVNVGNIKSSDTRLGPLFERREYYHLLFEQKKEEYEKAMKEEEMGSSATPGEGVANVECGHKEQPLVDIGDVLACPARPRKFRVKARVVDFMPNDLEDFSVRTCSYCSVTWSTADKHRCPECKITSHSTKWQFALLLEGEDKCCLPVIVADQDAEYLLGMNPVSVRDNLASLSKLREKLFLLWGTLLERRGEVVQGMWFECCVKEYDIRESEANYSKRRWRIFDTKIV